MKKIVIISAILSVVLLLSGCGPEYQTTYSYVPPHSWRGRRCINRCLEERSMCEGQCQGSYQSCETNARIEAMPEYMHYLHHRHKHHKPAYQNLDDFTNDSMCTDTCGCKTTYRECFENCGGQVFSQTVCVAFCNQASPAPG